MAVQIFRNTDAGAPQIYGGVVDGDLNRALEWALCNKDVFVGGTLPFPSSGSSASGQTGIDVNATIGVGTITVHKMSVHFLTTPAAGTYRIGVATGNGSGGAIPWLAYADVVDPVAGDVTVTLNTPVTLTHGTPVYHFMITGPDLGGLATGPTSYRYLNFSQVQYGTNFGTSSGINTMVFAFRLWTTSSGKPGWTVVGTDAPDTSNRYFQTVGTPSTVLYSNDTNTTYAGLRGYESFVSGAGVNPYPDLTQRPAPGIIQQKGNQAGLCPWIIVADGQTVNMFVQPATYTNWYGFNFGRFYSFLNNDQYAFSINGRYSATTMGGNAFGDLDLYRWGPMNALSSGAFTGTFIARSHTGLGGSIPGSRITDWVKSRAGSGTYSVDGAVAIPAETGLLLPNPADGKAYVAPIELITAGAVRGRLRGLWVLSHRPSAVIHGDTIQGITGSRYEGKTFMIIKPTGASSILCVEVSDTWDTN